MYQFSPYKAHPELKRTPASPVPNPSIVNPRSTTTSFGPPWTMMPFVPETSTPAIRPLASIEMHFVMVTAPNPPGSRTSISPQTAALEMAPANVLHGAVRLHGLASSPTPATQVRDACA